MLPSPMNPTGVLEAIDLEHTAARLAATGRCRRLQYRRPEAAPRSSKEAAMLPPPRLPAVTSAAPSSPTDYECAVGRVGTSTAWGGTRTRSPARGGHSPGGEEHGAARPGTTERGPSIPLRTVERINQSSKILRSLRTTNSRPFRMPTLGVLALPPSSSHVYPAGGSLLVYQNVEGVWEAVAVTHYRFLRAPDLLEPPTRRV